VDRTGQPRTTLTPDLSATLRSAWHTPFVGRMLNLSAGGMLLADSDLEVGETTHFELAGPGLQFVDLAAVVHRTGHPTGLRFLNWEGPAYRPLCVLIATPRTLEHAPAARRRRSS
jgi:hypothetical protein